MVATRKRQIVWRTALVLAVLVVLPVAYLGWYGAFNWHYGRQLRLRTLPAIQTPSVLQRAFTPLYQYELTAWPGARALGTWRHWCINKGGDTGQTWEQCWNRCETDRQSRRRASRSSIRL